MTTLPLASSTKRYVLPLVPAIDLGRDRAEQSQLVLGDFLARRARVQQKRLRLAFVRVTRNNQ